MNSLAFLEMTSSEMQGIPTKIDWLCWLYLLCNFWCLHKNDYTGNEMFLKLNRSYRLMNYRTRYSVCTTNYVIGLLPDDRGDRLQPPLRPDRRIKRVKKMDGWMMCASVAYMVPCPGSRLGKSPPLFSRQLHPCTASGDLGTCNSFHGLGS